MKQERPAGDDRRCGGPVFHPHMSIALRPAVYRCMARFRLGCWALQVNIHRRGGGGSSRLPREQRQCRLCAARGVQCVEDELHVALECPTFATLRGQYASLFGCMGSTLDLCTFLNQADTHRVAMFLHRLQHAHANATAAAAALELMGGTSH